MPDAEAAGRTLATLTIDLAAVAENYRMLAARAAPAECAGVVKAEAYGLGVARVAPALWEAGCRSFFVATLDEGLPLRALLPAATIYVLGGLHGAAAKSTIGSPPRTTLPTRSPDFTSIRAWRGSACRPMSSSDWPTTRRRCGAFG
jgi:alanine racemase